MGNGVYVRSGLVWKNAEGGETMKAKRIVQRVTATIVALVLVVTIVCSLGSTASAAWYDNPFDFGLVSINDLIKITQGNWAALTNGDPFIPAVLDNWWSAITGNWYDDANTAEDTFVQGIYDTYGAAQFSSSGYIVPLTPNHYTIRDGFSTTIKPAQYPAWSEVYTIQGYSMTHAQHRAITGVYGGTVAGLHSQYVLPTSAYVTLVVDYETLAATHPVTSGYFWSENYSGRVLLPAGYNLNDINASVGSVGYSSTVIMVFRAYLLVEPIGFSLNAVSSPVARIGNHDIQYGTTNNNGDVTTVNDNRIINETNNTFYNPTTNETHNITDWNYDYSTRTYTISIDNGDKYSVEYGDTSIAIQNVTSSETHNYYYVTNITVNGDNNIIGDNNDGNNSGNNSNNSGGGSGSNSDNDSGGSSLFDWLWNSLKRLISTIFSVVGKLIEVVVEPVIDALIKGIQFIGDKLGEVLSSIIEIFNVIPDFISKYAAFITAFWAVMPESMQIVLTMVALGLVSMVIIAVIKQVLR